MTARRLLAAVAVVSVVLVVAIGASRVSIGGQPCAERVWKAAVEGLTDRPGDPRYACSRESQERLFAVAAGLMGLVLVSTLLNRRD